MEKKELFSKMKMSEMVGWSEGNGRRWVNYFKEYIPSERYKNRTMYTKESVRILNFLKDLSQTGLTMAETKKWVEQNGIPGSKNEANRIIDESNTEQINRKFDTNVAKTIPSVKEMIIPYLNELKDSKPCAAIEVTEKLAQHFKLSEYQKVMRYETNTDSIFLSRIRSARYSLKKEGYIEEINKLIYQITEEGLELLNDSKGEIENEVEELEKLVDPLTVVKENIVELKKQLADSLLKELKKVHWIKFEDIVIELLTAMGYGDGEVTQRSNDGGLDGVIKEDKLGLDNIYVQAKRWGTGNSVGREVVQSFSGALDSKGARKGVFITTSHFTEGAKKYAERLESKKIILIDGIELSNLMITYNVGVDITMTFEIKDIDYNYFKDE